MRTSNSHRLTHFLKVFTLIVLEAMFSIAPAIWAAEPPLAIRWQKGFGGAADEWLQAVQETSDGGFVVVGTSESGVSGNKTSLGHGSSDYWVLRLNADGDELWENSFGGSGQEIVWSVQPTSDGGYVVGGSSSSEVSGNKTSVNHGGRDYWVVKLNSSGEKIWDKSFGGSGDDELRMIRQTSDGGYLLGGDAWSGVSGNKTNAGFGNSDYWLVKLNEEGNKIWEKSYGGDSGDSLYVIQPTTDGGYILGGWSFSGVSGNKTSGNFGSYDYWVVKLDANGEMVWDRAFGGNDADYLWSVQPLSDGNYLLGGASQSYPSGNKTSPGFAGPFGTGPDYWVVKLDALGNKVWDSSFGGDGNDTLMSLQPTGDDFLLGGSSASGLSGNKGSPNLGAFGSFDCWVLKLDLNGNKIWEKSFGGADSDVLASLQATRTGYLLASSSASGVSGNKTTASHGGYDFWLLKLEGPPVVVTPPVSRSVDAGETVTFSVVAQGAPSLTYQWLLNGASLSSARNSSLIISNAQPSDAGEYTVVVTNPYGSSTSQVARLTVMAQPTIHVQPQARTVAAGADVTLSVVASGGPPPSFQWRFNGDSLPGATASKLTMLNVQPSQSGEYSVTVSNVAGSVTSAVVRLNVINDAGRAVLLASANATAGGTVDLPLYLLAQGNENALACSLNFDPSIFAYLEHRVGSGAGASTLNANTNEAISGRLGFTLSLGADASFTAGTQEVVIVSLLVRQEAGDLTTPVSFGDQPVIREVSDALAHRLAATFADGSVTVGAGGGYEADVTPLPFGDNVVTATDWVKVGRHVAGLDAVTNASQFQRVDCAPRSTLGEGVLTVSDWVQAGRYAAGLDPLTPGGGPRLGGPGAALRPQARFNTAAAAPDAESERRTVRVVDQTVQPNETNQIVVQLLAAGNESALDFSLSFDSSVLRYAGAAPGVDLAGGVLNVNTNGLATGKLGFALTMPIGNTFAAGTRELVRLAFVPSMSATGGTTVAFADQPVLREISDAFASALAADYANGVLTVGPKPLRLELVRHQANGGFSLLMGNADGSSVESQRATQVEVLATTNLAARETAWIKLTNSFLWTNGMLRMDEAGSNIPPRRFYQVVERP